MLVSQKLAIAAHLHVLLRRKTGRVTDTEWMAENLEYALEIVRFTRAKAEEDGHPELHEWADKLERAVLTPGAAGTRPLVQLLKERAAAPAASAERSSGFGASTPDSGLEEPAADAPKAGEPRYVGGLR